MSLVVSDCSKCKEHIEDTLDKQLFQPPVPITEGLDPLSLLTDDAQIAVWNNEGLPSDRMSTENATILSNSDRWPLMIDPQVSYCCLLKVLK